MGKLESAIENYQDAVILLDLRRKRILGELEEIEQLEERAEKASFLYWNLPRTFHVKELAVACGLSQREFLSTVRKVPKFKTVICVDCQLEFEIETSSRSKFFSNNCFRVCEACKVKRKSRYEKQREEWDAIREDRRTNVEVLRTMTYADYLLTDHWKELRSHKLRQARYRCELCNSPSALQVHHKTYKTRGMEDSRDLIVLCEKCHTHFHEERKVH